MKLRVVVLLLTAGTAAFGQFGGILNRAKEKIDKTKPVTDRASRAAGTFQPWTAEEEQQIGAATAAKMVAMFGVIEDPKLVRYVNMVGQTVAQFASRALPYRFAILDADIVGAFALPGGYIFITRGALSGMSSEAQLAGALGHELVHCAERHLETEIRSKKTSSWAVEEARTNVRQTPAELRGRADAFLNDLFNTRLSQDKESSADQKGSEWAAQAGYSASGLLEFLRAMVTAQSKPENSRMFGQLLSTHPSFDSRIEHLTPLAQRSAGQGQTLEARFLAALPR